MANPVTGYETTFITKVDMTDPAYAALNEKLAGIVKSFKGDVVQSDDWGRRKLAYPIQKEQRGRYGFLAYTGAPGVVAELERNLRINENVIRFLTVKVSDQFNVDEYKKKYQPVSPERSLEKGFREFRGDRGDRFDRGDRSERGGPRGESRGEGRSESRES